MEWIDMAALLDAYDENVPMKDLLIQFAGDVAFKM